MVVPTEDLPDEGVQQCVDLLELALNRPVILEDASLRPIAYSKQPDDIDRARLNVILHRGATPEFLRVCQDMGISTARAPLWTPARPEWDMEPRLCVPVRTGRTLLGYLWVLTPEGSLSEQQVDAAAATASFVAKALDTKRKQRRSTERDNQMLLASLLDDQQQPANLLANLATNEDLPPDSRVAVLAFDPPHLPSDDDSDVVDRALEIKERLPGTQLPVRWMVYLGNKPAVLALTTAESHIQELTIARAAQTSLSAHFKVPIILGAGGGLVPLTEVQSAYERAVVAAWVARISAGDTRVLSWTDMGSWRLLARLTRNDTGPDVHALASDLHPGLIALLDADHPELVDTLDAYLTNGGDARSTAASLHLHRSTLYYRIDKISEITGANLKDGEARFELMLGLRIATLLRTQGAGLANFPAR